jgi:hypothetical protein
MNMNNYIKMRALSLIIALSGASAVSGQSITEGFEMMPMDSGAVLNGSRGERDILLHPKGPFVSKMPVLWDTSFGGYWAAGWAVSRKLDGSVGASDYTKHLYCAKPGHGSEKNVAGKYNGKAFVIGMNGSFFISGAGPSSGILGFKIANTTFAYNSMKSGDAFAKKFGGSSGNDADSFVLKISAFHKGQFLFSKRVILADFRFANNAKDYILDSWAIVDLSMPQKEVGPRDSFVFELMSSDNGQFGMNTPGFFAIDEVIAAQWLGVNSVNRLTAKVYPNPAEDFVSIETVGSMIDLQVNNAFGELVYETKKCSGKLHQINIKSWTAGVYTISASTVSGKESSVIVKR